MVGHTHEDIDQLFSRIAGHIGKNNIRILIELMEAVGAAYTPSPVVEFVDTIYDVRKWQASSKAELHNITNPHCFVIKEASNGDVVLKYKNWSRDKTWKPSNVTDEGVVVLKSGSLPSGVPDTVPPSSEKIDLKRLKDDIPKFFNSRAFQQNHIEWWNEFLADKEGIFKIQEKPATWLLDDIIAIKRRQHSQVPAENPHESTSVLPIPRPPNAPPEIEMLVAEEISEIPKVYSGRYRRPQAVAAQVNRVENPLEALKVDAFVAVHIKNYNQPPVIAKVTSVNDDSTFGLVYWKGSWRKEWEPWIMEDGELWTDTLPTSCILVVGFDLDKKNKLYGETYKYLRQTYRDLESN